MTADYFGTHRYATIRGLTSTIGLPVSIIGPVLTDWMFDRSGSYSGAFMIYAVAIASGFVWMSLIRRPTLVQYRRRE